MKVIADTNNGIMKVDSFDYEGLYILDEETFIDSLMSLSDEELIGAEISEEAYNLLKDYYGIIEE